MDHKYFSKHVVITYLNKSNRLTSVTETRCVFSEIDTEFLNIIQTKILSQRVNSAPLTTGN
jgi:hypothetical protein